MSATASPTTVALLSLMKIRGVGRRTALRIVGEPGNETDLHGYRESLQLRASELPGCRIRFSTAQLKDAWEESERQISLGEEADVEAISFHDFRYPVRLRQIPDAPTVLFVKGKMDGLNATKSLAVVGTREPTAYGIEFARRSAMTAVEAGFSVVSGLAHGCDTHAHEGLTEMQGIGVAVLAHGLDRVYPAANRNLAQRLLENDGCLVSEYPIGTRPVRAAFVERDRLQSGLSDAVLVIETGITGGTMHTVRFAREQNRQIASVNHSGDLLGEDKVQGNQKLLKEGTAIPISNVETLRQFLSGMKSVVADEISAQPGSKAEKRQMSMAF